MATTKASKNPKPLQARAGCVYVRSLQEVTDDEALLLRSIETVRRRPRKGAPIEQMYRITFYIERQPGTMLQLRKMLIDAGCWPASYWPGEQK